MKTNLIALILVFCLLDLFITNVTGQHKIIQIDGITDATIDIEGNIYVSTKRGTIIKFDSLFTELFTFASDDIIPLTSIDVSFHFRIFGFYQVNQSYFILDRHFKALFHGNFDTVTIGNGTAATYATDNSLWIFDDADLSLKKLNPTLNQIEVNIKLPLLIQAEEYLVNQLEAYQNRIFVNNYLHGIYVFDQFGNYLKKLPVSTNSKFTIYRESLIFIADAFLKSINIYSNEIVELGEIPDVKGLLKIILYDDNIYLIYPESILQFN